MASARPILNLETLEAREVPTVGLDTSFGTAGTGFVDVAADLPGVRPPYSDLFALDDGTVRAAGVYAGSRHTLEVVAVGGVGATARVRIEQPGETIDTYTVAGNGDILVASHTDVPNPATSRPSIDAILRRYRPDGSQFSGTNFDGTDSKTVNEWVTGLTLLSDGDILVQTRNEYTNPAYGTFINLFRLNSDSTRDFAFGRGGVLRDPDGAGREFAAFTALPDGGFVAVAEVPASDASGNPRTPQTEVVRFLANGKRDTGFGGTYDHGVEIVRDHGVASDGAGGFLVRAIFDLDAPVVHRFGPTGAFVGYVGLPPDLIGESVRIVAASDGGIIYTGTERPSSANDGRAANQVVGKLTAAGYPDETFAPGGRVELRPVDFRGGTGDATASDLLVRPNGQILALGVSEYGHNPYAAMLVNNPAAGSQPVRLVENSQNGWYTGTAVPVTIRVEPYLVGPVPTGTVTVRFGGAIAGTAPVGADGVAQLRLAIPEGPTAVTIEYSGDAIHKGQTLTRQVNFLREGTSTTLWISDPAPQLGEPVTLQAQVKRWSGQPAKGVVIFTDNGVELGRAAVDTLGIAQLTDLRLRLGGRKIVAEFIPDSAEKVIASASAPLTLTVSKSVSLTGLTVTPSPSAGPTVLVASVRTQFNGSAIGTVTFRSGAAILGTARVDGNGVARLSLTLPAGQYAVVADYSGSSTVAGSLSATSPLKVTGAVTAGPSTVTLAVPASASFGQPVPLTASVRGPDGKPATSGAVKFYDGTFLLGTAAVDATGTASFTAAKLGLGVRRIRAVYDGASAFGPGASAPSALTVTKQAVGMAFVQTPVPGPQGTPVTLDLTVSAQFSGAPIGTVTLKVNGLTLGTASVNGNGLARIAFPQGYHAGLGTIRLEYSGSSTFAASYLEWEI